MAVEESGVAEVVLEGGVAEGWFAGAEEAGDGGVEVGCWVPGAWARTQTGAKISPAARVKLALRNSSIENIRIIHLT
jgi:hypothetical protein